MKVFQKRAWVLCFDSDKVIVAFAHSGINNTFQIRARSETDFGGIVNGEFVDTREGLEHAVQTTIYDVVRATDSRLDKLCIGVPDVFCEVKTHDTFIQFDRPRRITKNDVKKLHAQIPGYNNAIRTSHLFYRLDDGNPVIDAIGGVASKLSVNTSFILAEGYFTANIYQAIKGLPFNDIEFVPTALAKLLYLIDEEIRDKTCLLISADAFSTSVALVCGDGILNLNTFDIGYMHVLNDLCVVKDIDHIIATNLIKNAILSVDKKDTDVYVLDDKKYSAPLVDEIIKARLMDVGDMLFSIMPREQMPVFITGKLINEIKGSRVFLARHIGVHLATVNNPLGTGDEELSALVHLAFKSER
ncbi:MAG: hypothetical protein FWE16_01035 [Firmicutes bacterium]|nr:hypothetical protein [Bacillota bacterium]